MISSRQFKVSSFSASLQRRIHRELSTTKVAKALLDKDYLSTLTKELDNLIKKETGLEPSFKITEVPEPNKPSVFEVESQQLLPQMKGSEFLFKKVLITGLVNAENEVNLFWDNLNLKGKEEFTSLVDATVDEKGKIVKHFFHFE